LIEGGYRYNNQPVEGPLHEKLSSSIWEVWTGSVWCQGIVDDLFKPRSPLLQWSLLLQRLLEILLQMMNDRVITSTNPRRLLLHPADDNNNNMN